MCSIFTPAASGIVTPRSQPGIIIQVSKTAPTQPLVVGVGGLIAAGKSSTAARLALRLHAPVVSADATRKHLAGLDRFDHGDDDIFLNEWRE